MSFLDSAASTSAAGSMRRSTSDPVLVGVMLAGLGTSAAPSLPAALLAHAAPQAIQTTAGLRLEHEQHAGKAIGDLRRLSGLTWEQLARLLGVSRRSLHFWASGKSMARTNEERLQRTLAVVRKIDRGSASANRALLLGASEDGTIAFDLLVHGKYEDALERLGRGHAERSAPARLSEEARSARAPQKPEELVDAGQERIHRELGGARAARSVKGPGSDRRR